MLLGEFMTAVQHRLLLKVVIFKNSTLGLALEVESMRLLPFRQAIEFSNTDFAAVARARGAHSFREVA
jgi:pyruvate dehydrogenase (quinone)